MVLVKKVFSIIALCFFALIGCKNFAIQQSKTALTYSQAETNINDYRAQIAEDPWGYIRNNLQIDIPENNRIVTERSLILKGSYTLEKNILRAEPYIYYIVNQFKQQNMPTELALLPLIESAYNPLATSSAKAAGLWQIVPITAKAQGLTRNNYYDPRRDLLESTNTAISLLQYLNKRFDGDWLLTLAAYNAGEGRVKRAQEWNRKRGLPTNYWALNLSKETMRYVPKLLAIIDIIKNSEQYHVALPSCNYDNSLVKIDLIKPIKLDKIAHYSGLELRELYKYNAGYLKKEVKGAYHLFVPSASAEDLYQKLKENNLTASEIIDLLQEQAQFANAYYPYFSSDSTNNKYTSITNQDIHFYEQEHLRYSQIIYRIKQGDNLYNIAKNHKVKVSDLLRWNKIKNANLLKPGDKLTINITNGSIAKL